MRELKNQYSTLLNDIGIMKLASIAIEREDHAMLNLLLTPDNKLFDKWLKLAAEIAVEEYNANFQSILERYITDIYQSLFTLAEQLNLPLQEDSVPVIEDEPLEGDIEQQEPIAIDNTLFELLNITREEFVEVVLSDVTKEAKELLAEEIFCAFWDGNLIATDQWIEHLADCDVARNSLENYIAKIRQANHSKNAKMPDNDEFLIDWLNQNGQHENGSKLKEYYAKYYEANHEMLNYCFSSEAYIHYLKAISENLKPGYIAIYLFARQSNISINVWRPATTEEMENINAQVNAENLLHAPVDGLKSIHKFIPTAPLLQINIIKTKGFFEYDTTFNPIYVDIQLEENNELNLDALTRITVNSHPFSFYEAGFIDENDKMTLKVILKSIGSNQDSLQQCLEVVKQCKHKAIEEANESTEQLAIKTLLCVNSKFIFLKTPVGYPVFHQYQNAFIELKMLCRQIINSHLMAEPKTLNGLIDLLEQLERKSKIGPQAVVDKNQDLNKLRKEFLAIQKAMNSCDINFEDAEVKAIDIKAYSTCPLINELEVKEVLQHIASYHMPVDAQFPDGKTLLEKAISTSKYNIAYFLIQKGADIKGNGNKAKLILDTRNAAGDTLLVQLIKAGKVKEASDIFVWNIELAKERMRRIKQLEQDERRLAMTALGDELVNIMFATDAENNMLIHQILKAILICYEERLAYGNELPKEQFANENESPEYLSTSVMLKIDIKGLKDLHDDIKNAKAKIDNDLWIYYVGLQKWILANYNLNIMNKLGETPTNLFDKILNLASHATDMNKTLKSLHANTHRQFITVRNAAVEAKRKQGESNGGVRLARVIDEKTGDTIPHYLKLADAEPSACMGAVIEPLPYYIVNILTRIENDLNEINNDNKKMNGLPDKVRDTLSCILFVLQYKARLEGAIYGGVLTYKEIQKISTSYIPMLIEYLKVPEEILEEWISPYLTENTKAENTLGYAHGVMAHYKKSMEMKEQIEGNELEEQEQQQQHEEEQEQRQEQRQEEQEIILDGGELDLDFQQFVHGATQAVNQRIDVIVEQKVEKVVQERDALLDVLAQIEREREAERIEAARETARKLAIARAENTALGQLFANGSLIYEPVPGDGHCFYHAAGLYLGRDQRDLRDEVAKYLEDNPDAFAEVIVLAPNQTRAGYICAIRNSAVWADHIEIEALMRSLGRPIVVIDPRGVIKNPDALTRSGEPILVYYNPNPANLHYDGLICNGVTVQSIIAQLAPALARARATSPGNNPYGHFANNSQSTGQTKQEVTTKAETPEVTNQR